MLYRRSAGTKRRSFLREISHRRIAVTKNNNKGEKNPGKRREWTNQTFTLLNSGFWLLLNVI
jgi:hypothetical protein